MLAVPSTVSPTSTRPVKPPATPALTTAPVRAAGGLGQRQQPGGGGPGDGRAHADRGDGHGGVGQPGADRVRLGWYRGHHQQTGHET